MGLCPYRRAWLALDRDSGRSLGALIAYRSPAGSPCGLLENRADRIDPPQVVISNQKPDRPLSATDRRQRTIDNLRQIGIAALNFESRTGHFPASWNEAETTSSTTDARTTEKASVAAAGTVIKRRLQDNALA